MEMKNGKAEVSGASSDWRVRRVGEGGSSHMYGGFCNRNQKKAFAEYPDAGDEIRNLQDG